MLKKSKSQCFISCVCITRFFIVWTNTQKVYEIANYEECVCSLVVVARGHCPSSLWQTECHCLEYCSCCGGREKQHTHTSCTAMKRFDREKKCYEPTCIINTCIAWKPSVSNSWNVQWHLCILDTFLRSHKHTSKFWKFTLKGGQTPRALFGPRCLK